MATLQKIRNRGTMLMLIVGLALFLFIIGAFLKNGSKSFGQSANMVGEIDGEPVSYEDYRKQVSVNVQNAEQRGQLSAQQRDAVEAQTWTQIVQEKLVGKEMNMLGITVTPDELSHIFTKKTDETVQNAFAGATAEQVAKQIAEIEKSGNAQSKAQLDNFKEYIKGKRENEKYFALLSQGLKAGDNMIKESTVADKANFNFIMRSYNTIADSTIAISDAEMKEYYETHKSLFKQMPSREISYVKIDVEPSQEDKAFAMKTIEDLKEKFATAKEPLRFASVNSEIQPDGRYFKKDEIKDADLAAFAFSGAEGVYGPFGAGNVLQISRVASKKMLPDSVRASHILVTPSANTQATVDSLMTILKGGADFATVAKMNSADKGSAVNGGDLGWFGKGRMVPSFEQAAFGTEKGKLTTVQTQFGTHIIKVMNRSALSENVQIATVTKETTPSNKTFQLALTEARHIAESVNTIDELKAVAKEQNLLVNEAFFNASSMGLQGVDNSKEIVRAAFKAEDTNKLIANNNNSTVFEMEGSYIIAGLKKINEEEHALLSDKKTKDFIKKQLGKKKKAALIEKELKSAMASASTLEALAEKEGVKVQEATNVSFANSFVSGLGQEPAVVATALLKNNQGVSQPVAGNQGVFVLANVVKEASENKEAELKQTIAYYNQMLQQRVQMAYQALFENADITDERYRF